MNCSSLEVMTAVVGFQMSGRVRMVNSGKRCPKEDSLAELTQFLYPFKGRCGSSEDKVVIVLA